MAGVPQSTLKWLYDTTQLHYRDPNRSYSDLAQALSQYPGLGARSSVHTSDNGSPSLLVNLTGTLPVNFRGTTYRFPLTLWIPQAYPYEPPIVYITPTDDMVVRQGQHVSGADGKVYHHYLAGWGQAWDRSNVSELLRLLADIFSREPPVMAKPQKLPQQRQQQPGAPPVPANPEAQSRQTMPRPPSQIAGPPPPPLPPPKQAPIDSARHGSAGPSSPAHRPGRYDTPPALPPQNASQSPPPQGGYANGHVHPPGGLQYMPQRQVYHPTASQHGLPQQYPGSFQATPGPSTSPSQALPQPHFQQDRTTSQYSNQPTHFAGMQNVSAAHTGPYPPPQQQQQQQPQPQPQPFMQQPPAQQQIKPQPKQPQRDLLSEEDPFQLALPKTQTNIPAPSIPPNPEKKALLSQLSHQILQHLHQSIEQTNNTAIPSLRSQNQALINAQANLNTELTNLQTLSSHLQSNINALTQTISQANNTITSTKNPSHPSNPSNIPSIDEIIIPPSVIARQLYDNVSEQRGYESAIYALNEAFVRGRIGSEIWSRKVRECAREEFRRKWMIKRIGEGLGLDGAPE